MEEKAWVVKTSLGAMIFYEKQAALENLGELLDDELTVEFSSRARAAVDEFLNNHHPKIAYPKTSPQINDKQKRKYTARKKDNGAPNNREKVLDKLRKQPGVKMTLKQLAELSGVGKSIGEVLCVLHKSGRVQRTKERPYQYWIENKGNCGAAERSEMITCNARSGKVIKVLDCVPNNKSEVCLNCAHFD